MFSLIFGPIIGLVKTIAGGFMDNMKAKQQLKAAVVTRKLEMIGPKIKLNMLDLLVFLVGIWFSRHHHAQITDTIGSLHHKVDAIQSAVDQIKKV